MRRVYYGALIFLLQVGCSSASSPLAPGPPSGETRPGDLIGQLAAGGYVIFFRHAERDATAMATAELVAADNAGVCAPGSELTAKGLADARSIGAAFQNRGVRVDRVYASPTCRTTQMATVAFGSFTTTRSLTWPDMWTDDESVTLTPLLRNLLGTIPARGTNIVLISHNNVLQAARIGVDVSLDQGESCIFHPVGGEFEMVGRVPLQEWLTSAATAAVTMEHRQPIASRHGVVTKR
jgi:broad specificity phosphatase PhoE